MLLASVDWLTILSPEWFDDLIECRYIFAANKQMVTYLFSNKVGVTYFRWNILHVGQIKENGPEKQTQKEMF